MKISGFADQYQVHLPMPVTYLLVGTCGDGAHLLGSKRPQPLDTQCVKGVGAGEGANSARVERVQTDRALVDFAGTRVLTPIG